MITQQKKLGGLVRKKKKTADGKPRQEKSITASRAQQGPAEMAHQKKVTPTGGGKNRGTSG